MKPSVMKTAVLALLFAGGLALTGCSQQAKESAPSPSASTSSGSAMSQHDMSGHSMDGGPAPAGIASAENPRFPVGSKVTLKADHMKGMKGAHATIAGAFTTITYAVDYTPTTGGEKVLDHRWVVQEELKEAGNQPLKVGDSVILAAHHMPGMDGAKAQIAEVTRQTVYMVDYQVDGMTLKNHKWVTEDEMHALSQ